MTKNSFLFIGGARDGTRMCVDSQRVEFPVLDDFVPTYTSKDCDIAGMVPFRTERYEAMRICGKTNEYVVYALEAMDEDEVLEALIRNYSVEKEK